MNKLTKFPVFGDLLQNLEYLDTTGGTEVWEGDAPLPQRPTSARPSVAGGFSSEGVYVCGDRGLGILTFSSCRVGSAACSGGGLVNDE